MAIASRLPEKRNRAGRYNPAERKARAMSIKKHIEIERENARKLKEWKEGKAA